MNPGANFNRRVGEELRDNLYDLGKRKNVRKTNNVPIVKPTRCTSFSNYLFLHETLHVSGGLSVHLQRLNILHIPVAVCTVLNSR
jgi:hypothetical protein